MIIITYFGGFCKFDFLYVGKACGIGIWSGFYFAVSPTGFEQFASDYPLLQQGNNRNPIDFPTSTQKVIDFNC